MFDLSKCSFTGANITLKGADGSEVTLTLDQETLEKSLLFSEIPISERRYRFYALRNAGTTVDTFSGIGIEGYRLSLTDKTGEHHFPVIIPKALMESVPKWEQYIKAIKGGDQFTFDLKFSVVTLNGERTCIAEAFA